MILNSQRGRWFLIGVVLLAITANARATEWYDDFNDGNAEDGNPVTWTPYELLPGVYDASSGDYVLRPTNDSNEQENLASFVYDAVFEDTYVRAQAYIDSSLPDTGGNIALVARIDPWTFSGYTGALDSGGTLFFSRFDAGNQTNLIDISVGFAPDTDILLELTAVGDLFTVTAWQPGQPKPEPQLTYTDTGTYYTSGPVGVGYQEMDNGTAGVFRWVAASSEPFIDIVESADFDGDGDIDGADFLIWQKGFGLMTGATPADGDANGDYRVDGSDLDIWKADFGTVGNGALMNAIPEPASALLAGLLGILCLARFYTRWDAM